MVAQVAEGPLGMQVALGWQLWQCLRCWKLSPADHDAHCPHNVKLQHLQTPCEM